MKTSFEQYGVECREGWHDLIKPPLNRILELGGEIHQVKEKFGTLRLYYTLPKTVSEYDRIQVFDMVRQAERESAVTCEVCGKPGKLNNGGWVQTLCDEHKADYENGIIHR